MFSKPLFREPLLHFLFIGVALFALDSMFNTEENDSYRIVVNEEKLDELKRIFVEGQGREPSTEELNRLVVKWSQNEVFYREARTLGLDNGDDMIRSRLVLKMQNILFNNVVETPPSDDQLKEWFEKNKAKYQVADRFDFQQFPTGLHEAAAAELARQLGSDLPDSSQRNTLRTYQQRPLKSLVGMFAAADLQEIVQRPLGQWRAVQGPKGLHLLRVLAHHPVEEISFQQAKNAVIKDWQKVSRDLQIADQAREIAAQYAIDFELDEAIVDSLRDAIESPQDLINTSQGSQQQVLGAF